MAQSAAISWTGTTSAQTRRIPWYLWACALAVTSASFGGVWDISWHESIGRDTFWTVPHMFIQFGGILAGAASLYLIFSTTFGRARERRAGAVRIWGFYGPLGAFICCWGGVAMVTSAPFDNWWHNAYGLDVKILSPPHVVLILGMLAIRFGAVILILGEMNRALGALRTRLEILLLYAYTFMLGVAVGIFQEGTFPNYMHSARFYYLLAWFTPLFLAGIGQVSSSRWACTIIAGFYSTLNLLFLWFLPLFPAQPKLGPVYTHVTHFVPPPFPILIVAPAFALDLLRPRMAQWGWGLWTRAAAMGAVFLAVLVAAQWPFAEFLHSPLSHNWVFGARQFPFFVPRTSDWVTGLYTQVEKTAFQFWTKMGLALVIAIASARAGLSMGDWMRQVRR
jgi:hypothetical protein